MVGTWLSGKAFALLAEVLSWEGGREGEREKREEGGWEGEKEEEGREGGRKSRNAKDVRCRRQHVKRRMINLFPMFKKVKESMSLIRTE
jgi:hypothetical protein